MTREVQTEHTDIGFIMRTSKDEDLKTNLWDIRLDADGEGAEGLWETRMELVKEGQKVPTGPVARRPHFVGITKQELEDLCKRIAVENLACGAAALTPGEWILASLYQADSVSIYRAWPQTDDAQAVFEKFWAWFNGAMVDAAVWGNMPHYQRQALSQGVEISDIEFDLGATVPSRELVKSWRVTRKDNELVDCKAETWATYDPLPYYPDPETMALVMRLAVERGRPLAQYALQEQLDALMATFMPFPRSPRTYWLEVTIEGGRGALFRGSGPKKVAVNTKIGVTISDGEFKHVDFAGSVQDDVFGRAPELCAVVLVQGN